MEYSMLEQIGIKPNKSYLRVHVFYIETCKFVTSFRHITKSWRWI